MKKTKLPKNKRKYIVTLKEGLQRVIYIYNPHASKKIFDKKGNHVKTVKNDGEGHYINVKLINGEIIILDTEKESFLISKLLNSGKIKDYEQFLTDQENKKLLEAMEKESSELNELKTSNKK